AASRAGERSGCRAAGTAGYPGRTGGTAQSDTGGGLRQARWVGSLNDLIRPRHNRRRDREAERLRGLQVDTQVERGWLLDGLGGRLRPPEDPVHVDGRSPGQVAEVRSVRDQAATVGEVPACIHRREAGLAGELVNPFLVGRRERTRRNR